MSVCHSGRRKRCIQAVITGVLLLPAAAVPQSGQAGFHGWVAFDGVAYVDKQPTATVELLPTAPGSHGGYHTQTDEHGFYHFDRISLGEFRLRISAPHYRPYETDLYVPSDFVGNLATLLKPAASGKTSAHEKRATR